MRGRLTPTTYSFPRSIGVARLVLSGDERCRIDETSLAGFAADRPIRYAASTNVELDPRTQVEMLESDMLRLGLGLFLFGVGAAWLTFEIRRFRSNPGEVALDGLLDILFGFAPSLVAIAVLLMGGLAMAASVLLDAA